MKQVLKKILAIVASIAMMLTMAVPAMAANTSTDDKTGSITVENAVNGSSYNAYKIFDVTYDKNKTPNAYSYTIKSTDPWYDVVKTYADESSHGMTLTKASGEETYVVTVTDAFSAADFANTLATHIDSTTGLIKEGDSVTATATNLTNTSGTATKSGLELGYWFVTTTTGSLCNLTTTNPNVTIHDKNDIHFEKTESDYTAEVGQTINYTLTGRVPDTTGYSKYQYKVEDTMTSGLTFQKDVKIVFSKDTTKVVIVGTAGDGETAYNATSNNNVTAPTVDYTTDTNGFNVEFSDMKDWQTYQGYDITITYSAKVNSDAITHDEENNTAKLTYSNNPNSESSTDTITEQKHLYSFNIVIDKYVTNATSTKLKGAEFALYKTETPAGGSATNYYYKTDGDGNVSWVELDEDQTAATDTNITKKTTIDDGSTEFDGLKAGTYYLVETKAPDGYNLLQDPITIVITADNNKTTGHTAEEEEDHTLSATVNNQTVTIAHTVDNKITTDPENQDNDIKVGVENTAGTLLPSTGGIGTTIFYVIGGIIVAGAVVLLVFRRKRA